MTEDAPPTQERVLALIKEATALADDLGLTDVGIDLNSALILLGHEGMMPPDRDAA